MDRQLIIASIISVLLFIAMIAAFAPVDWMNIGGIVVDTSVVAQQMFQTSGYGVTLLVVGALLGASMVGGVYLAMVE